MAVQDFTAIRKQDLLLILCSLKHLENSFVLN